MSVDLMPALNTSKLNSNFSQKPAQAKSSAASNLNTNYRSMAPSKGDSSAVSTPASPIDSVQLSESASSKEGGSRTAQAFAVAFEQGNSRVSQVFGGDGGAGQVDLGGGAKTEKAEPNFAPHVTHKPEQSKNGDSPGVLGNDGGAGAGPKTKVAIIDNFNELNGDSENKAQHGDMVEGEYRSKDPNSDVEIVQSDMKVKPGESIAPSDISGDKGLDKFIDSYFKDQLNGDNKAWQQLSAEQDKNGGDQRTVVSQSQGTSDSRIVSQLLDGAQGNPDMRHELERQLGLPESKGKDMTADEERALAQAIVNKTSQIHHSEGVQGAADKLHSTMDQASDKGMVHTISAGNEGGLIEKMKELGVGLPADFFKNEMAGANSIIVGNADTRDPNNIKPASTASPGVGADISAPGVEVSVPGFGKPSGASVATPQIASKVQEMLAKNPSLSREQILKTLKESAIPVPGHEDKLGAGVVS